MKTKLLSLSIILTIIFSFTTNAQTLTEKISELNTVLTKSVDKSVFVITKEGKATRTDNNKNTYSFDFSKIENISLDNKSYQTVELKLKNGNTVKGVVKEQKIELSSNLLYFSQKTDAQKAIKIIADILLILRK